MAAQWRFSARTALVLGLGLVLGATLFGNTDDPPATQRAFCKATAQARQEYQAAAADPNRLAAEPRRQAAIEQARQALQDAVPAGRVEAWLVIFEGAGKFTLDPTDAVKATFKLDCARLRTANRLRPAPDEQLLPGHPAVTVLSGLKAGSKVTLSGQLLPDPRGKYAFEEASVTESGAFDLPEFVIRIDSVAAR